MYQASELCVLYVYYDWLLKLGVVITEFFYLLDQVFMMSLYENLKFPYQFFFPTLEVYKNVEFHF